MCDRDKQSYQDRKDHQGDAFAMVQEEDFNEREGYGCRNRSQ
jgi:hypothetical protein